MQTHFSQAGTAKDSGEVVRGRRCRCEHCQLSVHVVETPAPTVCPYCQRLLTHEATSVQLAPPFPVPTDEEIRERLGNLYSRPSKLLVIAIGSVAMFMLGWAVFLQLRSAENYWYQPMVSIYSLLAGIFVVSRFILASFYVSPKDVGYEPTVTVLVPCMNEAAVIRQTIERIFSAGYPLDRLEVVCVNDGSSDNTLREMLAAQTRHPRLVVVDFEKNRGLCHAWGVSVLLARGEFIVCVDSDTFIFPGSLRKLVQGFVDASVGGISGHCDVENASSTVLTRMQDVRYFFSYKIMKAAESVFGTVSCLPGCFSAYRRVCVLSVLDGWINATVMGHHGNFADDRSLTNRILKDYKILYDEDALATTIAPESWRQYSRQQARWMRSYLREIIKTGVFMWRKHPLPALSWYAMMWMPIFEPVVMLQALVIGPVMVGHITADYMIGVLAITLVWSLHFWASTGRRWWWGGLVFTFSYIAFYSWQIYWALLTLRGKKWGTRG
jgi:hyaluronan synthase